MSTLPINWIRALGFKPAVGLNGHSKSQIANSKGDQRLLTSSPTEALQGLQDEIAAWQQRTFPAQSLQGKLAHLVNEARELRDDPDDLMEWADVVILALGAAAMRGLKVDDLVKLARMKFEVVKQRKWGEANGEGFHHHVKD